MDKAAMLVVCWWSIKHNFFSKKFCSQRREMLLFLGNFDNEVIEKED